MSTNIAIGDTVKVLRASTAWGHMEGVEGEVLDIYEDNKTALVKDQTGQGMWPREGGSGWWFSTRDVEKIEPVELKVGDTVRVLKTSIWHKLGETGKVQSVSSDGTIRVNDWWISPKEVELVTEKPKARSQEIEKHEIQKNDLIVAFWQVDGVELRRKGIAIENDDDDDWMTEEGSYLTYDDEYDTAEHIYLIERPEATGFVALNKTKKYFLKGRDGSTDYVVAFEEGNWTYGWVGDNTRVNAKRYEKWFTEGNGSWEKPVEYKEHELADGTYWVTEKDVNDLCWWKVEVKDSKATWGIRGDMSDKAYADYDYLVEASKGNWHVVHTTNPFPEPTNLEKFERAGNVGQKYKHCGMIYKLSKKGKVKVRSASKGASWYNSAHTVGSFLEIVEFGDAVKN